MTVNPTQRNLIDSVQQRWSPYRFDSRGVEPEKLASCFEAASWAASSFNEQPWRFMIAMRDDQAEFDRALGCLMEANQAWARHAGAIILTAFRTKFSRNENPNRVALHDLGQAAAHLALQATTLGLQVHQMAGVNLSQIRTEYQLPDEFEPATAIAIGYPQTAKPETESEKELAARESSARKRRPLSDLVFHGQWGSSPKWL
ncbi:nitroreductase family protein [Stieleria sp. TO1_6]|uniref:nitroreductase family protein n=1 Tax=Stieleria tagensis TaxID=2956795 RepID=UPI00209A6A7F|nr:nitroreductase family protein [Stieleria tagensis]MCO8121948.1 nitroreductase family protein [Stieleria tagensis]